MTDPQQYNQIYLCQKLVFLKESLIFREDAGEFRVGLGSLKKSEMCGAFKSPFRQ